MIYSYATADISQLEDILNIYRSAQAYMEANGNPQWQKGFPDENDIRGGIYGGILYTVKTEGKIVAVFSVVNHDGNYDTICGNWLTGGNYLAVHRVAVREDYRGKGAAKYIVDVAAEEIAKSRGKGSIRMDTHEKNIPMRKLLLSHGFTECGFVSLIRDDTERIAFEKKI